MLAQARRLSGLPPSQSGLLPDPSASAVPVLCKFCSRNAVGCPGNSCRHTFARQLDPAADRVAGVTLLERGVTGRVTLAERGVTGRVALVERGVTGAV